MKITFRHHKRAEKIQKLQKTIKDIPDIKKLLTGSTYRSGISVSKGKLVNKGKINWFVIRGQAQIREGRPFRNCDIFV